MTESLQDLTKRELIDTIMAGRFTVEQPAEVGMYFGSMYGTRATDYYTRSLNRFKGLPLCEHCEGTGNEFLAMYKRCSLCQGTGTYSGEKKA